MMDGVTNTLNKIPFFKKVQSDSTLTNKIGWYFNIIPFQRITSNIEDKESRLYYTKQLTKGGFNLGLKGSLKYTIWGIPYDKLPLPDWAINKARQYLTAEVNLVLNANAKGEVMGELEKRNYVESTTWETKKSSINPAAVSLSMKGGVEGIFKVLEGNQWFSIDGSASGLVNAEIISVGYREGKFGIYPLRRGVRLEFTANYGMKFMGYDIDIDPVYEFIQIIDPPN